MGLGFTTADLGFSSSSYDGDDDKLYRTDAMEEQSSSATIFSAFSLGWNFCEKHDGDDDDANNFATSNSGVAGEKFDGNHIISEAPSSVEGVNFLPIARMYLCFLVDALVQEMISLILFQLQGCF